MTTSTLGYNFGVALQHLKLNHINGRAFRAGWNGKTQYIKIQYPDAGSANTLPYLYIITEQKQRVPWLASQTDMLSNDWLIGVDAELEENPAVAE